MDRDKQPGPAKNSPAPNPEEKLSRNSDVEQFFDRLKSDMRRPRPSDEAIAAALQAIQKLAHEVEHEQAAEQAAAEAVSAPGAAICAICGSQNREQNAFCGKCGAPLMKATGEEGILLPEPALPAAQPGPQPEGQHHYHHHYHHHYFPVGHEADVQAPGFVPRMAAPAGPARDPQRLRAPLSGPAVSRAETTVRKMTQDWALACNTRQLDDLVDFYAPDALLLRSNFPPVRGAAAIREFFCAALDAGLGEVEMEPLRVELCGDIAYEAGRCKMLVPVAVGKRREERGKYLVIFARQTNGEWKAVSDCWSSDLGLQVGAEPEAAKPNNLLSAGNALSRPPRKTA